MKSKVTMVCKMIWRAVVVVEHDKGENPETVKDKAWARFDANCTSELEQENYTKVEAVEEVDENIKPPEFDK